MKMHRRLSFGKSRPCRGFSLVEVLLAVFILSIGLIMVASVFPVGANWTRQTTEESVAQTIAQDAITVLQKHYGPTGDLHNDPNNIPAGKPGPHLLDSDVWAYASGKPQPIIKNRINYNNILNGTNPFDVQPLPEFANIPITERSYQFGRLSPFPAQDPRACTYFWTALGRLDPSFRDPNGRPNDPMHDVLLSPSYTYDIYILVFRKGTADQTFGFQFANNSGEFVGLRNKPAENFVPSVYVSSLKSAVLPSFCGNAGAPAFSVGSIGIGQATGTVFHIVTAIQGGVPTATAMPPLGVDPVTRASENVIWSCPADGTTASPLIYVYQTTLTF